MSQVIAQVATVTLGLLLVVSGVAKLRASEGFSGAVATWHVPRSVATIVAGGLPPTEVILGFAALTSVVLQVGVEMVQASLVFLFLSFAGLQTLLWARLRSRRAKCGCFGRRDQAIGPKSIGRAAALAAVAAAAMSLA
jgi:hypothetical protein